MPKHLVESHIGAIPFVWYLKHEFEIIAVEQVQLPRPESRSTLDHLKRPITDFDPCADRQTSEFREIHDGRINFELFIVFLDKSQRLPPCEVCCSLEVGDVPLHSNNGGDDGLQPKARFPACV